MNLKVESVIAASDEVEELEKQIENQNEEFEEFIGQMNQYLSEKSQGTSVEEKAFRDTVQGYIDLIDDKEVSRKAIPSNKSSVNLTTTNIFGRMKKLTEAPKSLKPDKDTSKVGKLSKDQLLSVSGADNSENGSKTEFSFSSGVCDSIRRKLERQNNVEQLGFCLAARWRACADPGKYPR